MWTLSVLVLTLLVSAVQASSSSGSGNYNYDLSGQALTNLYNSGVYEAELMIRPFFSVISHSGVRVTLSDGSQWLIHKGNNYGIDSDTVVTRADHMSSKWKTVSTKNFQGTRTVADLVRTGGASYSPASNCHVASAGMMDMSLIEFIPFCFYFSD